MSATTAFTTPVHGGLSQPVNRIVSAAGDWQGLAKVEVNETDQTTLYRIADGTLSPLTGPMNEADYRTVLDSMTIERDGKKWAWSIPIVLPVTDAEAQSAKAGEKLGLYRDGKLFGAITVNSVYAWDKKEFIEKVYGTERTDHPGARLWTEDARTKIVGGEIELVPFQDDRDFAGRVMSRSRPQLGP